MASVSIDGVYLLSTFQRDTKNAESLDGKIHVSSVRNASVPLHLGILCQAEQIDASIIGLEGEVRFPKKVMTEEGAFYDPLVEGPIKPKAGDISPLWVTLDIPADIEPGTKDITLDIKVDNVSYQVPISIEVLPLTLPNPENYSFWLDIWQDPGAIARHYDVELWSEDHARILLPYLQELASAGQKVVTTTIIEDAWSSQTPAHPSMVKLDIQGDKLTFDFSVFDWYVELAEKAGITGAINCYSMVPFALGNSNFDDLKRRVEKQTNTDFDIFWQEFFDQFIPHLEKKGWLGKTRIAFDETHKKVMEELMPIIKRYAPQLGVAHAAEEPLSPELEEQIDDYSVQYGYERLGVNIKRSDEGKKTTFYVCCAQPRPNTFVFSNPAEAMYLPLHAYANNYDGMLRWASTTWPKNPLVHANFNPNSEGLPAGDTFLLYPGEKGPVSSIRWKMLIQGIQLYETIKMLEKEGKGVGDLKSVINQPHFCLPEDTARYAISQIQDQLHQIIRE